MKIALPAKEAKLRSYIMCKKIAKSGFLRSFFYTKTGNFHFAKSGNFHFALTEFSQKRSTLEYLKEL